MEYSHFNYTKTLELVYGVSSDDILSIHGKSDDECSKVILGHYWVPEDRPDLNDVPNPEDMDTRVMEGNELINDYFGRTFKSVDKVIDQHASFFNDLESTDHVFVLGHSLSEVDLAYFKKIVSTVSEETEWNVSYFGDEELERHKITMRKLGVRQVNFIQLRDL